ncbi:hypothetical protein ACFSGI_08955 [Paenibacillus nicotianae]|uniref:Copper amine oxidase N-terminal domain-containing protein n=1 Tax=Paenibacillus nicotianae TaxID=1526551 RepID=A0ABW4UVB8_9BACL
MDGKDYGKGVSETNPVPVVITEELPYSISKKGPGGISGNDTIDLKANVVKQMQLSGHSAYFRNTGSTTIYYDSQSNVTNRKTPLYAGARVGPITDADSLYFVCSVDTTLHYMFVGVMTDAP